MAAIAVLNPTVELDLKRANRLNRKAKCKLNWLNKWNSLQLKPLGEFGIRHTSSYVFLPFLDNFWYVFCTRTAAVVKTHFYWLCISLGHINIDCQFVYISRSISSCSPNTNIGWNRSILSSSATQYSRKFEHKGPVSINSQFYHQSRRTNWGRIRAAKRAQTNIYSRVSTRENHKVKKGPYTKATSGRRTPKTAKDSKRQGGGETRKLGVLMQYNRGSVNVNRKLSVNCGQNFNQISKEINAGSAIVSVNVKWWSYISG